MSVLLLPLVGPLQAWSLSGPYREKTVQRLPTKSGVVGLLAACLGRPRGTETLDLARLRLHVRVDREGHRLRELHTAQGILRANGKTDDSTALTQRDYLEGAAFLACLEGSAGLLGELHAATRSPVFVPYLGRRACLPGLPLWHPDALREQTPLEALGSFADLGAQTGSRAVYLEGPGPLTVRDQPGLDRAFHERHLSLTRVETPA